MIAGDGHGSIRQPRGKRHPAIGCRIENKGIGPDRLAEQNRRYNNEWTKAGTHTPSNSGWPSRHARAFLSPKAPALGTGMLIAGKDQIPGGAWAHRLESNPCRLLTNLSVIASFF